MESGLLVLQVIIGIICCLFGLKFQKTIVAIIGCVVGYLIGDYLVGLFTVTGGLDIVLRFVSLLVLQLFETLFSKLLGLLLQ